MSRYPREPSQQTCSVCDKSYLGNDNDPCPRCGGDVDVAGFHRATDYRAECAKLNAEIAALRAELAKHAAIVEAAKAWRLETERAGIDRRHEFAAENALADAIDAALAKEAE